MMKPMRRKDRQITEEKALEIFKKCVYATLSTTNPDGSPYAVPISPAMDGRTIYIHGMDQGQKMDNVKNNSKVCLTCVSRAHVVPEEFTTEFESVTIHGTAEILRDPAEIREGMKVICEKYAMSNMHNFEKAMEENGKHVAIFKISIDNITGKAKVLPKAAKQ